MAGKPTPAPDNAPKKKQGGMSIMTLLIAVLLAAGASGGATWWLFGRKPADAAATADAHEESHAAAEHGGGEHGDGHGDAKPAKKPGEAEYLSLDPAFVVNMADDESQHYLQTDVQVMARSEATLDVVKAHMPRIRNNLLMLFAQQKTADVHDKDGRERLRSAALKEVQDVLQAETGKPGVEALYFTSFVTQ